MEILYLIVFFDGLKFYIQLNILTEEWFAGLYEDYQEIINAIEIRCE